MQPFDITQVPLTGRSLVEASAGTGKTYAISSLVLRLLLETPLTIDQIVVVTFTEAATTELRERIRARLQHAVDFLTGQDRDEASDPTLVAICTQSGQPTRNQQRLAVALRNFDDARISTIHGFCQHVLSEFAFESKMPFAAEFVEDLRPLQDEIVRDYWAKTTWEAPSDFSRWLSKRQFKLENARALVSKITQRPNYVLLPETRRPEEPKSHGEERGVPEQGSAISFSHERAFQHAFAQARNLWQRGDVQQVVEKANLKNARHYQARFRHLAGYFASERALPALPEKFESFGSAAIASAARGTAPRHAFFLACDALEAAATAYAAELDEAVLRFKADLASYYQEELERRKRGGNLLSFDDLLLKLHRALTSSRGAELARLVAQRYRAALVDEFQDTDDIQYGIFSTLAAKQLTTFFIGDPKQSIYSFRGADVFTYMKAVRDTEPSNRYTMTTSYRSDPRLIEATNALFSRARFPFLLEEIQYRPVAARPGARDALLRQDGSHYAAFELLLVETEKAPSARGVISRHDAEVLIPGLVAQTIVDFLSERPTIDGKRVAPSDIAVLTRTNLQAFQVQAALRAAGLVSVVVGDRSVYRSEEARELQFLLAAALEPTSRRALRAALATELLGYDAAKLLELEQDELAWEVLAAKFRQYSTLWAGQGFIQMFDLVLTNHQLQERLLALGDGERRLTNLLHLAELLHTASKVEHLGPHGLLRYLAEQRSNENFAPESEQVRLESDNDAITLTTVHKSKGMEYPIVYCPYVAMDLAVFKSSTLLPAYYDSEHEATAIDLGSAEMSHSKERQAAEHFAENARLLYVALTRAKHRTSVLWGRFANFDQSALSYLLFPPVLSEFSVPTPDEVKAQLKELSVLDVRNLGGQLAQAPGFEMRELSAGAQVSFGREVASLPATLDARTPLYRIDTSSRTGSFTNLTRDAHAAQAQPRAVEPAEGRDWDERSASAVDSSDANSPELARLPELRQASSEATVLQRFPRGARAGNFFHELFENLDFTTLPDADAAKLIANRLHSYSYDPALADTVTQALHDVLHTPLLQDGNLELCQVSTKERLNELEFFLPVAPMEAPMEAAPLAGAAPFGSGAEQKKNESERLLFSAEVLARVFAQHPSRAIPRDYAAALTGLGFVPLRGYLKGYIDLVFRHQGRYYLVDYKTNHLGDSYQHYSQANISLAMAKSHYFLQYHLYTLALHRYLGLRLPDYDYTRHFGGVFYLFIKGMRPTLASEFGVFHEVPPLERIEALSKVLNRPEAWH